MVIHFSRFSIKFILIVDEKWQLKFCYKVDNLFSLNKVRHWWKTPTVCFLTAKYTGSKKHKRLYFFSRPWQIFSFLFPIKTFEKIRDIIFFSQHFVSDFTTGSRHEMQSCKTMWNENRLFGMGFSFCWHVLSHLYVFWVFFLLFFAWVLLFCHCRYSNILENGGLQMQWLKRTQCKNCTVTLKK